MHVLAIAVAVLAAPALAEAAPSRPSPQMSPRAACGCPTARLLARGPQVLDGRGGLSAWLHDGARLEAFAQEPLDKQRLRSVDAPIVIDEFAGFGDGAPVATSSRLVRVRASGELAPGTFVGVMRRSDLGPKDVIAVSGFGANVPIASPQNGAAPRLRAMWLAPLEKRDRPGCGPWNTQRVAFELVGGTTAAPEAFLVKDLRTGTTALVDARHAGVFGFGRVEVCEQGLELAPGEPTRIEVRPVSASFGIGEPWSFSSDGTGTTDVVRLRAPASADAARILEPFPVPGQEQGAGPTYKEIAIFVMGGGIVAATLVALFLWVIVPARRRRMKDVVCPACARKIPIDSLDPKTDGCFCPSCGAAGFWKGAGNVVDASALPRVDP